MESAIASLGIARAYWAGGATMGPFWLFPSGRRRGHKERKKLAK